MELEVLQVLLRITSSKININQLLPYCLVRFAGCSVHFHQSCPKPDDSTIFVIVKLDVRFIGWTLANKASSSIPNALYQHLSLSPFVNSIKVFAASHKTRLTHNFVCSIGTYVLPHLLIEVISTKPLHLIELFDSHLDFLPFQISVVELVSLRRHWLKDNELLNLTISSIMSSSNIDIVKSDERDNDDNPSSNSSS